jgi:hypothetical protein
MLTIAQKINILFNKFIGNKSYTKDGLSFDEEQFYGRPNVLLQDVWIDTIPQTNPLKSHITYSITGAVHPVSSPVIYKFHKQPLTPVTVNSGNTSFYNENVKNIIQSEYGDGSYQYQLWRKDVNGEYTIEIPFGYNSWYFDNITGVLNFVNELPNGVSNNNPPAITCYKYVGRFGDVNNLGGNGGLSSDSVDNITIEVNDDDKLQIVNKFKQASFYRDSLTNDINEVGNTFVINHSLNSMKVTADFYRNADGKKVKVNVPYEATDSLNVTVYFNPQVRSGDFSVKVVASY